MLRTIKVVVKEEIFKLDFEISEYESGDLETPPVEGGEIGDIETIFWWKKDRWINVTQLYESDCFDIDFEDELEKSVKYD